MWGVGFFGHGEGSSRERSPRREPGAGLVGEQSLDELLETGYGSSPAESLGHVQMVPLLFRGGKPRSGTL